MTIYHALGIVLFAAAMGVAEWTPCGVALADIAVSLGLSIGAGMLLGGWRP